MSALSLQDLRALTRSAAAIRALTRLQPAGGPGDKIFPPTFATNDNAETKYALEQRRIGGETVDCVLLDSVASQANRMEEALRDALEEGAVRFPVVQVDFTGHDDLADLGRITSLDAPHRVADAILRDSTLDGQMFRTTRLGRSFTDARPDHATPMYQVCPHALIFGIWDSTGPKGGLGAKFQRVLVSEVVAVNVARGVKSSSRIDPLSIAKSVPIYASSESEQEWVVDEGEAAKKKGKPVPYGKDGKASEANHGNIAPSLDDKAGGITFDYAQQTTVLSLTGLRQLRFRTAGDGTPLEGPARAEAQLAARTALAALALVAITHAWQAGFHLRSRCSLVPDSDAPRRFEVVHSDGSTTPLTLTADQASELLAQAAQAAAEAGLPWELSPVTLTPSQKLVTLVRESRKRLVRNAEGA